MRFFKDIKLRKLLLICLMVLAVQGIVYTLINAVSEIKDVNLISRGIDSGMKMWLNGYLGLFFGFHYSGNINWLVLPLVLYFLITIKKRQRWEIALVLFYIIAFVFIGANGYFNSRYALTLIPITIGLLFLGLQEVIEKFGYIKYQKAILIFILLIAIYNNVNYTSSKNDIPLEENKSSPFFKEYREELSKKIAHLNKLPSTPKVYAMVFFLSHLIIAEAAYKVDYYFSYYMYSFVCIVGDYMYNLAREVGYKILIDRSKPDVMLNYLNDMVVEKDQKFLVNNIPVFYYYTNKKGIYYWCGDDVFFASDGKKSLLTNRTFQQTSTYMKDSLNCPYIFSYKPYDDYYPKFKKYLRTCCEIMFVDVRGDYRLYKIK